MEASIETLSYIKGAIAATKNQTPEEHLSHTLVPIRLAALEEVYESAVKFFAIGEKLIDTEARMLKAIEESKTTAEDVMAARAAQKADMKTLAKLRAEGADQAASIASREALLGTRIALKIELTEMTKQRDALQAKLDAIKRLEAENSAS